MSLSNAFAQSNDFSSSSEFKPSATFRGSDTFVQTSVFSGSDNFKASFTGSSKFTETERFSPSSPFTPCPTETPIPVKYSASMTVMEVSSLTVVESYVKQLSEYVTVTEIISYIGSDAIRVTSVMRSRMVVYMLVQVPSYVMTYEVQRIILEAESPEGNRVSTTILIGLAAGGAVVVPVIAAIVTYFIRHRRADVTSVTDSYYSSDSFDHIDRMSFQEFAIGVKFDHESEQEEWLKDW